MQLASFDTPWKHQKTYGFLMFSGGGGVSKETNCMKWIKKTLALTGGGAEFIV